MKLYLLLLISFFSLQLHSQVVSSDHAEIVFYSKSPLEDIEAKNANVKSLFDLTTGEIVFSLFIEDFDFDSKLMKKHFQNKYMEIDEFPKSTFKGKILGWNKAEFDGPYTGEVVGQLTIHGVTNDVSETIALTFDSDQITSISTFMISLKDYEVSIPKLMFQNIAEEIEIKLEATYTHEN